LTDEGAFATRIAMLHRFRSFPSSDPELPADADGLGRARAEVVATFDEVYGGLEEAATRYFVETAAVRAAAA
jgi:phenylacetic acid degradation operon negative regulatory protein